MVGAGLKPRGNQVQVRVSPFKCKEAFSFDKGMEKMHPYIQYSINPVLRQQHSEQSIRVGNNWVNSFHPPTHSP